MAKFAARGGIKVNRRTVRQILGICFFAVILIWFFCFPMYSEPFWRLLVNILMPFAFGFCIAYLLNLVVRRLEEIPRKKGPMPRGLSLTLAVVFFLGVIGLTIWLIIPRMASTFSALVQSAPEAYERVSKWLADLMRQHPEIAAAIEGANIDWDGISQSATGLLQENAGGILGGVMNFVDSATRLISNLFMGFMLAMTVLPVKEKFFRGVREFILKHMGREKAKRLFKRTALLNEKFRQYFESQFLEGLTMGVCVWLVMLVIGIPYAPELGVLNGVLYLIPSIGTPIAMVLGAILVVAVEPIKALWYLLAVLVLQVLIQSILHPHLIQTKVKLPGHMEFVAVLLFGFNFGVPGMIVSVPLTAWLYELYWKRYDHLEPEAGEDSSGEKQETQAAEGDPVPGTTEA